MGLQGFRWKEWVFSSTGCWASGQNLGSRFSGVVQGIHELQTPAPQDFMVADYDQVATLMTAKPKTQRYLLYNGSLKDSWLEVHGNLKAGVLSRVP